MNILRNYPHPSYPITIEKAQGHQLFTKEFGSLIDMESGCWAAILGHCNSEITETISASSQTLFHTHQFLTSKEPSLLVQELCEASGLPLTYKGTFLTSGTEAVSLAVMLAQKHTERNRQLSFNLSYLGGSPDLRMPRPSEEWDDLDLRSCMNCSQKRCESCPLVCNLPFSSYSSFVFEPGNSGGLVLCQPQQVIQFLTSKVREYGGLIIANEVTTGMGRCGKWWGHQYYPALSTAQNCPDIICIGKGLGNGYPISGILVQNTIAQSIEASSFYFVQSHLNDPIGCNVARKVISILSRDHQIEKGNQNGAYFRHQLHQIALSTHAISDIRGIGMMNIIELSDSYPSDQIFYRLLKCGYFTGYSVTINMLHLYCPLTLTKKEIDDFCSSLNQILSL